MYLLSFCQDDEWGNIKLKNVSIVHVIVWNEALSFDEM